MLLNSRDLSLLFKMIKALLRLRKVMQKILQDEVRTLDHKWLRAVGPGENTGFHTDSVSSMHLIIFYANLVMNSQ